MGKPAHTNKPLAVSVNGAYSRVEGQHHSYAQHGSTSNELVLLEVHCVMYVPARIHVPPRGRFARSRPRMLRSHVLARANALIR